MFYDNQLIVAMEKNPMFHGRTKHKKIKYHIAREAQKEKLIRLEHCKSKIRISDILIKAL